MKESTATAIDESFKALATVAKTLCIINNVPEGVLREIDEATQKLGNALAEELKLNEI
jgi:hypothetical protein